MKNIPLFKVYMSDNACCSAVEVLKSGYIGQGAKVDEFEENLRNYFSNTFVSTVNSATSGLTLAIHLLKDPSFDWPGLQEGDEVLCTPLTCTATNWPVLANNLNIKWVDIDPTNLNMDLNDLARKITPRTKIILPVHWGGNPINLNKLKRIQEKAKDIVGFKPIIIEDAAHAMGSTFNGKRIGGHGNISVFSFQAIKHVTSVDGGAICFSNPSIYKRSRLLRWYGIDRDDSLRTDFRCESDITEYGFKFHMNDVCASIGIENLKDADRIVSSHQDNARYYQDNLKDISGVQLLDYNVNDSASWIYTIKVYDRDNFMKAMKDRGIICSRVHERNDKHTCVKQFKSILPSLDEISKSMICIPNGWWVTTEDREYIKDCIIKGW